MSPTLKKVLAAVAVKKAYDRVRRQPEPKKPWLARVGPKALLVAAVGGGVAYAYKSGRLKPLLQQVKSTTGGDEGSGGVTYRPESHPVGAPVG